MFFLFLFYFSVNASTQSIDSYIELTNQLNLYESKEWLDLGHYKKKLISGYVSTIDDPRFFLSAKGKYNPKDELEATLQHFLNDSTKATQCRYMARRKWLFAKLNIPNHLEIKCEEQIKWKNKMSAEKVTLVFAASYPNNPASLFGHTFLKFHSKGNEDKDLLNYGISYAASTGSDGGMPFAVKGLLGFYQGEFSMLPYHQKLLEYTNLDGRDIWEYELNFSRDELDQMLNHLLELDGIKIDYYFFDENCSYQLLTLFDVARPELELSDQFIYHVIPSDTVQLIFKIPNLVNQVRYRPSLNTKLKARFDSISKDSQKLAIKFIKSSEKNKTLSELEDVPVEKKTEVLDIALDYAFVKSYSKPDGFWAKHIFDLKKMRAAMGVPGSELKTIPPDTQPEKGQFSARVGLGAYLQDKDWGTVFNFRPAYHDLTSPSVGFLEGAQIEVLSAEFLYLKSQLKLNSFELFDIQSLTASSEFESPLSWRTRGGYFQNSFTDERAYELEVGVGKSKVHKKYLLGAFLDLNLMHFDNFRYGFDYGPGVVVLVGARILGTGFLIEAKNHYLIQNQEGIRQINLEWGFYQKQNKELRLKVSENSNNISSQLLYFYYF